MTGDIVFKKTLRQSLVGEAPNPPDCCAVEHAFGVAFLLPLVAVFRTLVQNVEEKPSF